MSTALIILVVLTLGVLLTFGATRATASVQNGSVFLRWMLVVFAVYILMLSLPVLMAA